MNPVYQLSALDKWNAWIIEAYQTHAHKDFERDTDEFRASTPKSRCWGHLGERAVCYWFDELGVWYVHNGMNSERDENGDYTPDFKVWSRGRWIVVEVKTAHADNSNYCMTPVKQWPKLLKRTSVIIAVKKVGESHAEIAGWNGSKSFGDFYKQRPGDPGVPVKFPTMLRPLAQMDSPDTFARRVLRRHD